MSTKCKLRPIFKCHGGKHFLAKWIISNFPQDYQNYQYVEPFCGGANVLLQKERSIKEVINDIDVDIINIFDCVQLNLDSLLSILNNIKYGLEAFDIAKRYIPTHTNSIADAANEIALRRMSRGGLKKSFAWSNRIREGKPGDLNSWETFIELLPNISERLKDVTILNKDFRAAIPQFNYVNTLIYADPPYLHETRVSKSAYKYEMSRQDHIELAEILNNFKGKVLLSGYPSTLYNKLYKDWNLSTKNIANHSSQIKTKQRKVECLWTNY